VTTHTIRSRDPRALDKVFAVQVDAWGQCGGSCCCCGGAGRVAVRVRPRAGRVGREGTVLVVKSCARLQLVVGGEEKSEFCDHKEVPVNHHPSVQREDTPRSDVCVCQPIVWFVHGPSELTLQNSHIVKHETNSGSNFLNGRVVWCADALAVVCGEVYTASRDSTYMPIERPNHRHVAHRSPDTRIIHILSTFAQSRHFH
jgi:hypothetical protein